MENPILSIFPSKKIKIGDQEIEIEGYRVSDSDYVIELMKARNDLLDVAGAYKKIQKHAKNLKNPDKIPADAVPDIKKLKNLVDEIQVRVDKASYPLAQRGLKRALYKDTEEYKKAQAENRLTEYIDSLPDIDIPPAYVKKIVDTMIELSKPELALEAVDTKKRSTSRKQKG